MTTAASGNHKRPAVRILASVCIGLLILCMIFAAKWLFLEIRVAVAAGQVELLIDAEEFAHDSSNPKEIAQSLLFLSIRRADQEGTPLSIMFDRVKWNTVTNMIEVLREKTGLDYGNDPVEWAKGLHVDPAIWSNSFPSAFVTNLAK